MAEKPIESELACEKSTESEPACENPTESKPASEISTDSKPACGKPSERKPASGKSTESKPACGLCSKKKRLTKTECCDNWICDDEHKYVLFSFAKNSCHRNHRRFTLCSTHHIEGHEGSWQDCEKCKEDSCSTPYYVWYGTNAYNFEKLQNPEKLTISCAGGCGFTADTIDAFPLKMGGGAFFCEKEQCQKSGCPFINELIASMQD